MTHAAENKSESIKGKTKEELKEYFKSIGEPSYRAEQAFLRINRHLASTADDFTEFPKTLREKLKESGAIPTLKLIHRSPEESGTEKCVFEADENQKGEKRIIEAVWIVSEKRNTLCISSQVGCSLNCTFCATGTIPFKGNLETWMILDQVYQMIRMHEGTLTNIVFMGMGEPFYNYDNVIKACRILTDEDGLNLSSKHITISTAGVLPGIRRFIKENQPYKLALSLNQPFSEKRRGIMDVEERFTLDQILSELQNYTKNSRHTVTFEYVCIPDVNMGDAEAREIIRIAKKIRCKVNLIPLNTDLQGFRRPEQSEIDAFQKKLFEGGVRSFNRGSPGRSVNAACGMLALKY